MKMNEELKKFYEAKGFWNTFREMFNDVQTIPLISAQGLGTSIPSIISGAIGATAGAVAGAPAAGAGAIPGTMIGGAR